LGDACEDAQNPGLLTRVEHFESFAFDGWAPNWDFEPEFTPDVDVVHANDSSCPGGCGAISLWKPPITGNRYSVEVSMVWQSGSWGYGGVIFAVNEASNTFWACLLNRTQLYRSLGLWNYPGSGTQIVLRASKEQVEPTTTGASVVRWLRAYRDGNQVFCEFVNENGNVARTAPFQASGSLDGRAGMRVFQTHAHFRSFTVYK
jgi:hypothetical protein